MSLVKTTHGGIWNTDGTTYFTTYIEIILSLFIATFLVVFTLNQIFKIGTKLKVSVRHEDTFKFLDLNTTSTFQKLFNPKETKMNTAVSYIDQLHTETTVCGLFNIVLTLRKPWCVNKKIAAITSKFEIDPHGKLGNPPG